MHASKREFLKTIALGAVATAGWPLLALGKPRGLRSTEEAEPQTAALSLENWAEVRGQFPLSRERAYFNNGTLGPSPLPVIQALSSAMAEMDRSGEHRESDGALLRSKLAAFIGADAEEISLTHNTTESINIVAQGLPLRPGDEVILTTHEHVGNALPWLNRARLDGIVPRGFEPARTSAQVLAQIESMITPRTRVIAVPQISCTTGQRLPVAELARLAHSRGAWIFVDGAHSVGMIPLDLHAMDIDFFASCGHKWLCGPKGTGLLYVRKQLLDTVEAKFVGAHSDTGWTLRPDEARMQGLVPSAHRYDYGSQNTALYAGLCAAIDFFGQIGMEKIHAYGCGLAASLQEALLETPGVEMLTPTEEASRAMMTSFRFTDPARTYVQFAGFAAQNGFRVRQVPEAGLNAIRVSTHLYNSLDEVRRFVEVVKRFVA